MAVEKLPLHKKHREMEGNTMPPTNVNDNTLLFVNYGELAQAISSVNNIHQALLQDMHRIQAHWDQLPHLWQGDAGNALHNEYARLMNYAGVHVHRLQAILEALQTVNPTVSEGDSQAAQPMSSRG